jgi:hypothetical protein
LARKYPKRPRNGIREPRTARSYPLRACAATTACSHPRSSGATAACRGRAIPSRLLEEVRAIPQKARQKTSVAVNILMVEACWLIGQRIVHEEQGGHARADYGSQLSRNLARRLVDEFGDGISVANLQELPAVLPLLPR